MKYIRLLKLWWFWNIHLKKNEFSHKLDIFYFSKKFPKLSLGERIYLMEARRTLAHELDSSSIESVSKLNKIIERAKI